MMDCFFCFFWNCDLSLLTLSVIVAVVVGVLVVWLFIFFLVKSDAERFLGSCHFVSLVLWLVF